MPTNDALIHINYAAFGYSGRPVIRIEQLSLSAGHCLGISGPNGAGKTTLVRGMTGLLPPMQGTVTRKPNLRIGYLPQFRAIDLHWPMTALDAAAMATSARRRLGWIGRCRQEIIESMRRLHVDDLAHRSFSRLSGGQQQRVLLAGALASHPQVLVLDEPTDGLDVHSRQALLQLLRDLAGEGLLTVIISHDVEDLMFLCNQIARVEPASEPGGPSRVECIAPKALAERLTHRGSLITEDVA